MAQFCIFWYTDVRHYDIRPRYFWKELFSMKYKLLVVDDEAQFRTTLCNCFPWEQIGFELAGQACNGKMALDFLKKNTVHVLLCDIAMPFMDGIELVKNLRTWENPPITVFISGYRDFEYARQAITYGVRFYVLKPIKYEDIVQTFGTIKQELDKRYNISQDAPGESGQNNFVDNVHTYVKNHLRTANLKDLSNQLYMNSSYVSQLYKTKTGRNFSDYLLEMRMKKAAELLKNSSEKIYTIGAMVGYNNAKNFARSFLTFYGKTPTEYRNIYRVRTTTTEESYE